MKSSKKRIIQPPKLSKKLPASDIQQLADWEEYVSIKITGGNLAGQAAHNIFFEEVLMHRMALTEARIPKVRLLDVRLDSCDLSGTHLEEARLRRVELIGCRLLGVRFLSAQLDDVIFRECNLEGAIFSLAEGTSIRFEKCILKNATFDSASLNSVTFDHCDLSYTDFRFIKLKHADLRGSVINGMQIEAKAVKGIVISPMQAIQMVGLLGLIVQDEDIPMEQG